MKGDLRDDSETLDALAKKEEVSFVSSRENLGSNIYLPPTCQAPVTKEQAEALAKELGAHGYFETSALKNEGVTEVFKKAAEVLFSEGAAKQKTDKPSGCLCC